LYEARKGRHRSVHCFPSGVDPAHFAQAGNGIARPADLDARPRPILGFYGVLDERVDLDLVAAVADARPDWTVAMVGPVAKIDEHDLPRRPNIVYYGKQTYDDLPAYLACFDVALLPFAQNEATRFISPTKTLEYMAGEKPIVSTPIKDVVDLYGEVVAFGATPAEFVAAIERTLAETPAERIRRLIASRRLLAQHTWDTIAAGMLKLMREALVPRYDELLVATKPGRTPLANADVHGYAAVSRDPRLATRMAAANQTELASAAGED
jgi:glycosyltransferase involved in cell wall biosynthesis